MFILKFGGSSVVDARQMQKVIEIVKQQLEDANKRIVVVLSACKGITDQLQLAANFAKESETENARNIALSIKLHHLEIIDKAIHNHSIPAIEAINQHIENLVKLLDGISFLHELTPASLDAVFCFGELLSTTIFHFFAEENNISNTLLDARKLLITNSNFNQATPLPDLYTENINRIIRCEISTELIITQGFIASDESGKTTTLGRGGSDLTASLLGAAIDADEIQIWTDVDGVLSADPRKCDDTTTISNMSFAEVRDLAFWGAKVLHPQTIFPAISKNITVKVLNTMNPASTGTTITAQHLTNRFRVNSIIAKTNCLLLRGESLEMSGLQVLYSGSTNGISTILIEDNEENSNAINSLSTECVQLERVSSICVSGQNFKSHPILFTKFLAVIGELLIDAKIEQLIYEFSETSVIFVISGGDVDKIVQQIHIENKKF